ncbi:MAG: DUF362 domain-containing protein [Candidatus Aminicenantes bacterium]|nr:DUF362 domain-containing protein [Candidatus Aminicenantes bacterium]
MKRREFIRNIAWGGAALQAAPSLWAEAQAKAQAKAAAVSGLPDLGIGLGDSPKAITKAAVEALGGMGKFVGRGDVVIIKPNIGWDRTPEMAACTNPEVVVGLIEMCQDAGAKKVIVLDNPTNEAKRSYIRSGIRGAAEAAGASVPFPNEQHLKKMPIKGEWLKDWEVFSDFLEADTFINAPIAKHHSLSRVTLGMKNLMGAIGGPRNQIHQKLDQALVDLANFFKPTLNVLDAYRMLVRNGPQGGRPSDTKLQKTVVAGRDIVAVDAMGATFFEIPPQELLFLRLAADKGFGRIDLEKLRIEKRTV